MIVTDIPNDPEEPGFTSYRVHSTEEFKGSKVSFLNHIVGILIILH
jgi:hypothetical protein